MLDKSRKFVYISFFYIDSKRDLKMKTYIPKNEEIERNWRLVDADGKVLGRIATEIADILRGKNKPVFTPHLDTGDFVVVVNAEKIKLTGNKMADKVYYHQIGRAHV